MNLEEDVQTPVENISLLDSSFNYHEKIAQISFVNYQAERPLKDNTVMNNPKEDQVCT